MLHLTAKHFETEVKHSDIPVVVMFYAIWCGKCAMTRPVLEDLEKKYEGRIKFCDVDIDESEVLAAEYEADLIPTLVLFQDGNVVSSMKGMQEKQQFEARLHKIFKNC